MENEGNYINQSPVGTCYMLPCAEFAGMSVWHTNVCQALTKQIRSIFITERRQTGTPSQQFTKIFLSLLAISFAADLLSDMGRGSSYCFLQAALKFMTDIVLMITYEMSSKQRQSTVWKGLRGGLSQVNPGFTKPEGFIYIERCNWVIIL